MSPIPPRQRHAIDQFLALSLEVQAALARHRDALRDAGWTDEEAWALCQRVEERILGPAMEVTDVVVDIEDQVTAAVRREIDRRK